MRICSVDGCPKTAYRSGFCHSHLWRWKKYRDPEAGQTAHGLGQRFIKDALASHTDDCLIWPFGKFSGGYGSVYWGGSTKLSHRVVCEEAYGASPSNQHHAAHSCGNSLCCNPRHIRWATPSENNQDKLGHGTSPRGERNPRAKLCAADVFAIRKLSQTRPLDEIGREHGVSKKHIANIVNRRFWAWLEG